MNSQQQVVICMLKKLLNCIYRIFLQLVIDFNKESLGGILKYDGKNPSLSSTFYEKTIWLTLKIFAYINVTQLQSHTIPGTVSVYIIIII